MLILLPPSEGKAAPARGRPLDLTSLALPVLTPAREQVLDALVRLCEEPDVDHAAGVLGVGTTQHELVLRNAELRSAPTARADRVYTGVLYDALDVVSLSTAARRRSATRVAVTSALFGLLRPGDAIPAYRLSGDTALPGLPGPSGRTGAASVAAFWREHLEPAVLEALGNGLLVDLRSSTYAAFWRPAATLAPRVAGVRVLHEHDGTRKVVSHFNKATKGRIVRAVLEDGGNPRTPAAFADQLRDLGWKVEVGEPARSGVRLDVVVDEV